jgi:hypothetical protein
MHYVFSIYWNCIFVIKIKSCVKQRTNMEYIMSFISCELFYDAISISNYTASNGKMTGDKVERILKESVLAYSRYYTGICLGLKKTRKNLSGWLVS